MSELFLARQTLAGDRQRAVVVKRLLPRLVEVPEQLAMFVNEGRILASLDHPNVVNVFELGIANRDYFLVMEYLRGAPLDLVLREADRKGIDLPHELVVHVIRQTCAALDHVHSKTDDLGQELGLIHRDLNAGNLMITFRGDVKLVDFGLAKITASADATKGGQLKGTYAYMSPEQCRGDDMDARSDLFSLGIMLYELCCRRRLFRRNNEFATIRAILEDPIPPPSSVTKEVSAGLEEVIMKALSRSPDDRFSSAQDMSAALEAVSRKRSWSAGPEQLADFMDQVLAEEWKDASNTPYGVVLPPVDEDGEEGEGFLLELKELPPEVKIRVEDGGEQVSMDFAPILDDEGSGPAPDPSPLKPGGAEAKGGTPPKNDSGLVTTLKVDRPASLAQPNPGKRRLVVIIAATLIALIAAVGTLLLLGKTDIFTANLAEVPLSSVPAGATVYLNGKRFHGVTPFTLKDVAYEQKNNLVLVLAGHEPWQHSFTLVRGKPPAPISATLKQSQQTQGKAMLLISSEPAGARVYLDGELKGKSDIEIAGVDCSRSHNLVLKLDGYKDHSVTLKDLKPDDPHMLEVTLVEEEPIQEVDDGADGDPKEAAPAGKTEEPVEIKRAVPLPSLRGNRVGETLPEVKKEID